MEYNGYKIEPRVNLQGATLREADLREANLREANLREANLRGADLRGADLRGADLREANLREADLREANLQGADLQEANLQGANLQGADLQGADLWKANLEGAKIPNFQIVPSEGSFIGWKKTTNGVVKLLICEDSLRTSTLVGRKCRASKVKVIGGEGVGGTGPNYPNLTYDLGATVESDFDGDIRFECTKGIHFFMTEKEAQDW